MRILDFDRADVSLLNQVVILFVEFLVTAFLGSVTVADTAMALVVNMANFLILAILAVLAGLRLFLR